MKYIVMDEKNGDLFSEEYEAIESAIEAAELEFNRLTDFDKEQRSAFYVLESINPDPDAEDHFDGNVIKRWI